MRIIYYWILSLALFLRYRIKVEGLENIKKNFDGGILFLANHPAEVDPCILLKTLHKFCPHPTAIDYLFRNKIIGYFLNQVKTLPIPHFEHAANTYKKRQMEKTYEDIYFLLRKNENILLYPAGGLKKGAEEIIGGASGVHTILQQCPHVNIVLIRTLGLWGSSFSRAQTGFSPDLMQTVKKRFIDLLKNAIFFSPRRKLRIIIENQPEDFPREGSRLEINRYLEKWYNQEGPEPLSLIPYVFWKKRKPKAFEVDATNESYDLSGISPEIESKVTEEIARLAKRNILEIHRGLFLSRDLGLDSLDLLQIILFLKDNFGINNIHGSELVRVSDVLAFASGIKKGKQENEFREKRADKKWDDVKNRAETSPPQGKTVQEAFLRVVDKMGSQIAAADLFSGEVSYRRLKLAALMLSERLKKIPDEKIGVMLPACIPVNVLIFALLLARKIPVMINWTLGKRNLEAIVKESGLQTVISSYSFLDRLENVDLTGVDDKILLIDKLISSLTVTEKITVFFRQRLKTDSLLKRMDLDQVSEDDVAVILFTSGTESVPKAVPLSHKNILSNQTGGYKRALISKKDVLLGVLPPFHSFGLSVTGLFPILSGLRVFYFPNPIDSKKIASLISTWKVTLICIVPTFLKNIIRVATVEQLKTLRLVVTGAEKTSRDLWEKLKVINPHTSLCEGYGITECGPILTMNPVDEEQKGVGKPLENVEIAIIDLIDHQRVPIGKEGLIVVRGPNIFQGYLSHRTASPFIDLAGEKWYNTGDLGFLDEKGYLTLSGRLKRFVKIGGEMISLGAIEEILLLSDLSKKWELNPDIPSLAVVAKEEEGKKGEIYLLTTGKMSLEEVNEILKNSGLSNLMRISYVKTVPFIPLLGTGKIDYQTLSKRL